MDHSTEKTELRELTDLEIENVNGGVIPFFVAGLLIGFAIGYSAPKP